MRERAGRLVTKNMQRFLRLLEGTRFGSHCSPEKLDPALRTSLLLFDKDILQEEGGKNLVIR